MPSSIFPTPGRLLAVTAVLLIGSACGSEHVGPVTVVRVTAVGCGPVDRLATGFAATPERVVTVAHSLRGTVGLSVDGAPATLVALDHRSDLAVLAVSRHSSRVATVSFAGPEVGAAWLDRLDEGGIHRSEVSITKVAAIDIDEPRDSARYRRDGLVATIARERLVTSGDSGSPVIDQRGRVVGLVFATDRETGNVAFATSAMEIEALLGTAGDEAVSSGPCDL